MLKAYQSVIRGLTNTMSPAVTPALGALSIPGTTNTFLSLTLVPFTYHTFKPLDRIMPSLIPDVSSSIVTSSTIADAVVATRLIFSLIEPYVMRRTSETRSPIVGITYLQGRTPPG